MLRPMLRITSTAIGGLTVAGLSAPLLAGEIIVDPGGTGDALTLEEGLAQAQDGDTLIVFPGNYVEEVTVAAMTVQIIAQQSGTVEVRRQFTIRDLGPTDRVLVDGIRFDNTLPAFMLGSQMALEVSQAEGDVTIQRCTFRAGRTFPTVNMEGPPAALIRSSNRVTLRRASFEGSLAGDGLCVAGVAGSGLAVFSSSVALFGVTMVGGDGSDCTADVGDGAADGGAGLWVTGDSEVFLSACHCQGGDGADNGDQITPAGGVAGNGGDGLRVDQQSRVYSQGSTRAGGDGGIGRGPAAFYDGSPGASEAVDASATLLDLPGVPQNHETPLIVRGESLHPIDVQGRPGATATLFIAERAPFVFDFVGSGSGPLGGPNAPPVPAFVIPLGQIPSSGVLNATVGIPALPPMSTLTSYDFIITTGQGRRSVAFSAPQRVFAVNCFGLAPDCNGDGVADLCELASGDAVDSNGNGIPDDCDP